jgi:hypothetical protein
MILDYFSWKFWLVFIIFIIVIIYSNYNKDKEYPFIGLKPLIIQEDFKETTIQKPVTEQNFVISESNCHLLNEIIQDTKQDETLKVSFVTDEIIHTIQPTFTKHPKSKSMFEHLCCEAFMVIINDPNIVRNYRPAFLTNPKTGRKLELDCWSEKRKCGVEAQGIQHYIYPNNFNNTLEEFEAQLERDATKIRLADENGTPIYRVSAAAISYKFDENKNKYIYVKKSIEEQYNLIYDNLLKQMS